MSDQNNAMKNYMSNNEVFADVFNYFAFDGKRMIPSMRKEMY